MIEEFCAGELEFLGEAVNIFVCKPHVAGEASATFPASGALEAEALFIPR